ncbi:UDP-N-acetylglucosamine--N-acetylmuramyl-(pentapeptide) pyrophosphoryl-undecaprenol N-acetylglucosamine transferase [Candidatus Shapirobacteria bacterium]|nr:UDP-N-acetylglucosamine--N-acetylmuramyl-(pentapeptide) pyrophosphoryl-undecaprenol N-acetylglucosamine transferase [Candidatus Shapirobacteria bacterium]
MTDKTIVITGGHLTPAQAVMEELQKGDWQIYYFGREFSLEGSRIPSVESQVVPRMGVRFIGFPAGRLQRRLTRETIPALLRIPAGFFSAFSKLWQLRPRVILSFGGYVSVPVVLAGWLLRIPILTHEQTRVFGLASKINSFLSKKVLVSYSESIKFFSKKKVILTGNPLREEIFNYQLSRQRPASQRDERGSPGAATISNQLSREKLPLIYITGGNQGGQVINRAVEEILPQLLIKYRLVHQVGGLDYEKFKAHQVGLGQSSKLKTPLGERYFVTSYVEAKDIGWVLNSASLVVSRAGANITSELAALGKPAILIPIPWSSQNEQEENAKALVEAGIAVILEEGQLSGKKLLRAIEMMMTNLSRYENCGKKTKALALLGAAPRIVAEIEKCLER